MRIVSLVHFQKYTKKQIRSFLFSLKLILFYISRIILSFIAFTCTQMPLISHSIIALTMHSTEKYVLENMQKYAQNERDRLDFFLFFRSSYAAYI